MPKRSPTPMARSSERRSSAKDASATLSIVSASSESWPRLNGAAAGDELEDQHDHRNHQQDVNQSAGDVKRESAEPQQQQNHDDDPNQISHDGFGSARGVPKSAFHARQRSRPDHHRILNRLARREDVIAGREIDAAARVTAVEEGATAEDDVAPRNAEMKSRIGRMKCSEQLNAADEKRSP